MIKVSIGTEKFDIEQGTTLLELAEKHGGTRPAMVAKVNGELQELHRAVNYPCEIQFLNITDAQGFRAYQRGVTLMCVYAVKAVLGRKTRVVVAHSIAKNYVIELPDYGDITEAQLAEIEKIMRDTAASDLPIEKTTFPKDSALAMCEELGMQDKITLLKYRHNQTFSFYRLSWMYNYVYGEMPVKTGGLAEFRLLRRPRGFMLQFPDANNDYRLSDIDPENRLSDIFAEANRWARIMKADTVGALNDRICREGSCGIIQVAEALHEKKIAYLADRVMQGNRHIVLIAGPTSSGKTTFAERLGVQLRVHGAVPHIIGLDNYYLNREDCPRDEHGNFDFETINALDTPQITADLQALIRGERVQIPRFNFVSGRREYKGNYLQMTDNDVIILEGIHGLNAAISEGVPENEKFKVFISALTQINIDDHDRIPTTDARLIRRMVRDNLFRGTGAAGTLDMWPSVLRGEAKYIYPTQDSADEFFNSALVYEMCVLKQYAEPLLFAIEQESPQYAEARRLIKFLSSFLGIPSEAVPPNSFLREFIGGSPFSH